MVELDKLSNSQVNVMLKKQIGMTLISWMIVTTFLGGVGLVVLKIIPAYMNYASVKSIMDDLARDEKIKGQSPKGIRRMLNSRLEVNDLKTISRDKKAFKFRKIDGGYALVLTYEERENLFANLDYVVVFDHEVELLIK